jgi:FkbM family methyltransferase
MRVQIISRIIWLIEYIFFYPQLKGQLKKLPIPKNPLVIFDVGANTGQSAKFFRKIFKDSKIYSFEPNPLIFKKLNASRSSNTFCFDFAIGNINAKSDFFVSKFSETSSLITPTVNSSWFLLKQKILGLDISENMYKLEVEVKTLDFIVKNLEINDIFLLKIDVEGSELEVLQGAKDLLSLRKIQYIQFEELRNGLYLNNFFQIDKLLLANDFNRLFTIRHSFGNFYEHVYSLKDL